MELNRAIAREHTALAAVLSDLRRQKVLSFAFIHSIFRKFYSGQAARLAGHAWTAVRLSSIASLQASSCCRCCCWLLCWTADFKL